MEDLIRIEDTPQMKRIERLIKELEYEIIMESQQGTLPNKHLGYVKILPPNFKQEYYGLAFSVEIRPISYNEYNFIILGERRDLLSEFLGKT